VRYERQIGDSVVVVNCEEDLSQQAAALLSKLEQLHGQGPPLHSGTVVQFGWSRLVLKPDGNDLVVCEPDFDHDPFSRTVPEVDRTLRVAAEQAGVCRLAKAVGPDVSFAQTVVIAKGHLSTPMIYLDRRDPEVNGFSGWYLGPSAEETTIDSQEQLEPVYIYQLLNLRPAVIKVLNLPINYLVVFSGDTIDMIFDATGTVVWPAQD